MKRPASKTSKRAPPATVDDYLAGVGPEKRAALEKLRRDIASAAPGADECISYGIPAFRVDGRLLVAFGAAAKHCAFYPGKHPLVRYARDVDGYDTSKGTIRFFADRPLPSALVRRLVRARIAERTAGKKR